jgi:hypothetical protein
MNYNSDAFPFIENFHLQYVVKEKKWVEFNQEKPN